MMQIAGFVLTGGHSTRMGRDKALLPVGSETLCERIAGALSQIAEKVWLVGHPERYGKLRYECLADIHPDLGPLSGLEAALNLNAAPLNLVSSCDAYNLNRAWLRQLVLEAQNSNSLCTAAQDSSGNMQPLCAVYRIECKAIVSKAIAEQRLRAMDLLKELNAKPVKVNGLVLNLNTPEQYQEIVDASRRQ